MIVSPDGRSVFLAAPPDDAIAALAREASGVLAPLDCIRDLTAITDCGSEASGLRGAVSVAISPDGRSVYAASTNSNAVVGFSTE